MTPNAVQDSLSWAFILYLGKYCAVILYTLFLNCHFNLNFVSFFRTQIKTITISVPKFRSVNLPFMIRKQINTQLTVSKFPPQDRYSSIIIAQVRRALPPHIRRTRLPINRPKSRRLSGRVSIVYGLVYMRSLERNVTTVLVGSSFS